MGGIVLLWHGHVASGLVSALAMVAGEQEAFEAIDLTEADAAVYGTQVEKAVASLTQQCDGVIVLCDLVGGTPFNCAMIAAAKFDKVEVIAGVNLAMLIECMFNRANTDLASLCSLTLAAGVSGIVNKTLKDASTQDQEGVACASENDRSEDSAHREEQGGI